MAFQSGGGFQVVGFQVEGPTGENITGAASEGPDTIAATAAILGITTAAMSEGRDTMVATAFAGAGASGAASEGYDTVAGTMSVGTVAAGAIAEGGDSMMASASVTSTALIITGSIVEGPEGSAGAATITTFAAGAASEGPDTVTGQMFGWATAASAASEGFDTVTGTAMLLPVSIITGNIQEGGDTFTSVIQSLTVITGNIIEGPDTFVAFDGFFGYLTEDVDSVSAAMSTYWDSQSALAEAPDNWLFSMLVTGVPFRPGNIWFWIPYGPQPGARPRIILEKSTYDDHTFDVICTNLLDQGATIATVDGIVADQGNLIFTQFAVNPATAYYEDGTVAEPNTVIQMTISGGIIPSYLSEITCTVRTRFTDSEGNQIEAKTMLRLTDYVTA